MSLDRVVEVCPSFRIDGPPRRSRKSDLLFGWIEGMAVVAKCARRLDPSSPWRWYAEREQAIYEHFEVSTPPVRVPRLIAGDPARGVLVLERLEGRPLAPGRCARAPLGRDRVEALCALAARLAAWGADVPAPTTPTPAQRRRLRADLLEDPSDPDWCCEAARRCARFGFAPAELGASLSGRPLAFGHGDLLLRNILCVDGRLALVDWECAGLHPDGWDLALLSVQLAQGEADLVDADPALRDLARAREEYFRRRWR